VNNEPTESFYSAPLDQLLSLGQPRPNEQRDYAGLGISSENIPALIRMAADERLNSSLDDGLLVWAPVHAWRALGQLRAVSAVAPLLLLFRRIDEDEDDWVGTDLPKALAQIGAAALEPAVNYLADTSHGEWARITAAETLGRISLAHPDLRAECVGKLVAQLEKFSEQSEALNAFLVMALWDLHAVEAMPVIERAYAANCVDESVVGDVEDVQIHFGLKTKREHPHELNWVFEGDDEMTDWEKELNASEQENVKLRSPLDEPVVWREPKPYVAPAPYIAPVKIGRNEPCPCGSGKKYKKCCGA
jgi:hypothetical protein